MVRSDRGTRRRARSAAPRPRADGSSHPAALFERHGWAILCAALFAFALIWRLAYLARLERTPLFGDLIVDAQAYWTWASALRAGATQSSAFYLGPLYPTWLWLLRSVLGDEIRTVLIAQALLSAGAVVLIADAARRLTRPSIGLAVGAIAALYEMAVFFDGLILMESLLWTLFALLLWWVCAVNWRQARAAQFAALGGLIALISEGRSTAAVLLAPALLLMPWRRDALKPALGAAGAMLAAFAIVAAPVAIQNWRAAHEWIPFTYNFGYNLYVGNNPEATGTDVTITGTQAQSAPAVAPAVGGAAADGRAYLLAVEHVDLSPAASSAYWARKALRWIATHQARAAELYARKLAMLWSAHEYPQIENADEFRLLAGPLGLPWIGSFACVGVLAVIGLLRVRPGGRAGLFLVASAAALSLVTAAFFVTDRYRHSLVPGALLLAALGMDAIRAAWSARSIRDAQIVTLMLALGIAITHLPIPHLGGLKYQWGLEVDLGARWLRHGRADLAITRFERAAALERSGRVSFEGGTTGAMERMQLYVSYGDALMRLDRAGDALAWYERAVTITPDNAQAVAALAAAYRRLGRVADALPLERRLGALAGGSTLAIQRQAFEAAGAGRYARAESLFVIALSRDGTQFDAWGALMRLQIQREDYTTARATLERARAAGLPQPESDAYGAFLDALEGHRAKAAERLARVPQSAIDADRALAEVVAWTRRVLAR
jgi:tetratricopeptide (TPR) repeat protein